MTASLMPGRPVSCRQQPDSTLLGIFRNGNSYNEAPMAMFAFVRPKALPVLAIAGHLPCCSTEGNGLDVCACAFDIGSPQQKLPLT